MGACCWGKERDAERENKRKQRKRVSENDTMSEILRAEVIIYMSAKVRNACPHWEVWGTVAMQQMQGKKGKGK